ncbi:MAG: hypothetical protein AAFX94_02785 [Myxococcota bacterium]
MRWVLVVAMVLAGVPAWAGDLPAWTERTTCFIDERGGKDVLFGVGRFKVEPGRVLDPNVAQQIADKKAKAAVARCLKPELERERKETTVRGLRLRLDKMVIDQRTAATDGQSVYSLAYAPLELDASDRIEAMEDENCSFLGRGDGQTVSVQVRGPEAKAIRKNLSSELDALGYKSSQRTSGSDLELTLRVTAPKGKPCTIEAEYSNGTWSKVFSGYKCSPEKEIITTAELVKSVKRRQCLFIKNLTTFAKDMGTSAN